MPYQKTLPFIHILFRFISMSMQITWQIQKNILKDENSVYGFGWYQRDTAHIFDILVAEQFGSSKILMLKTLLRACWVSGWAFHAVKGYLN